MTKESKKEMSIADYKVQNVKVFYRSMTLIAFIVGLAIGLIGAYFSAVHVVTSTQNEAVQIVSQLKQ